MAGKEPTILKALHVLARTATLVKAIILRLEIVLR